MHLQNFFIFPAEALVPIQHHLPRPHCPAPGNHHLLYVSEFDHSRDLMLVELYSLCPFLCVTDVLHLA